MKKKDFSFRKALSILFKVITFPSVCAILAIVILVMLFNLAQSIIAPSRISDDLKAQMEETDKIMRVEVCLDFTPEDFHIKALQSYGSVAGVTDHSIFLMYVSKEEIERQARVYWVDEIKLPE